MSIRTAYKFVQLPSPVLLCPDEFSTKHENLSLPPHAAYNMSPRSVSASSMLSSGSVIVQSLRVRNENVSPSRTTSLSTVEFNERSTMTSTPEKPSLRVSHKSSWGTDIPLPAQHGDPVSCITTDTLEEVDLNADCEVPAVASQPMSHEIYERSRLPRLSFAMEEENLIVESHPKRKLSIHRTDKSHPFRRWMSTIHRKSLYRRRTLRNRGERWTLDDFIEKSPNDTVLLQSPTVQRHRKSSSWASSGFVTAVKSAGTSIATMSLAPPYRKTQKFNPIRSSHRSNRLSHSLSRPSIDNSAISVHVIDGASQERAQKRRRILEELVDSEESYVADLKVLVNASILVVYYKVYYADDIVSRSTLLCLPLLQRRLMTNLLTYTRILPNYLSCTRTF